MAFFRTESGSLYEIDEDGCRVRRLAGLRAPTPRQGEDGQWKGYVRYEPVRREDGSIQLWFQWGSQEFDLGTDEPGLMLRGTITSVLTEFVEDDGRSVVPSDRFPERRFPIAEAS